MPVTNVQLTMEHGKDNFHRNCVGKYLNSHEEPSHLENFEREKHKNIPCVLASRLSDGTPCARRSEITYTWKILKWKNAYEKCSKCQMQEENENSRKVQVKINVKSPSSGGIFVTTHCT